MSPVKVATVNSPIGPIEVAATRVGVRQLGFGSLSSLPAPDIDDGAPAGTEAQRHLDQALRELTEFFDRSRDRFTVALDWSLSSGWAGRVRQCLWESVGYGETVSYGRLAQLAGRPDGARAVGGIMAGNPIPVIVPCHRVIAADGGLGGFAGSGGAMVETKRRLLELEGSAAPTLF
ncbi:methylated-DNA--[protein]-cysteine S-methyltransferase [Stackebrandtia endophytica]|nr:methylated-DNA--[protein]-cysteine S-methyltransferase [Stackebrandtia endophytica]